VAGHRQAHRDVRHPQRRNDRQGHRLPVDVEVRVPRRRRAVHQPPGQDQRRAAPVGRSAEATPIPTSATTCSKSTTSSSCRSTRRSASSSPPTT
jgi:hypothetical protein